MGKGRPRAVEKGALGLGHYPSSSASSLTLNIPQAPVFYPTEDEFKEPLDFIRNIRSVAEPYGICRIVPPKSWKPPFALNLDSFTFPTKSQAIHRLQARSAACDPATFELEYDRFVQKHTGRKPRKKIGLVFEGEDLDMCKLFNAVKRYGGYDNVTKKIGLVFEGEDLDMCKLFNAVKRYGGYDNVTKEKKWGNVFRFMRPAGKIKISECSKHVLCQLYREHLYDYEVYHRRSGGPVKRGKKPKRLDSGNVELEGVGGGASDQICEQCKSGLHGDVMLLCDRCNKGWHLYCLSPPLEHVPSGNWYCLECVNLDKDSFGFVPGKRLSLESFSRAAERAKRKWLGSMCAGGAQIEKRFWEIVEGSAGEVEVMYGSDLDTSLYGSGFPRVNDSMPSSRSIESEVWKEYCASPWNLNNLPKLEGSMLRAVHDNIAGVMVPWLYIGMLFSSFCWHFEDHCFYSMNYLHWGEPKCWYSVPGSEARSFEQVMRKSLPDLFDTQPDLLFQLVTMLNPSVLQENGVPVYSVLQEPGNFIITFPRSFHGGFNFGLNCAEAVNFAPADWLPHGGYGAELYRLYHKSAVLSHEELLFVTAKSGCNSNALPYLKEEMLRIFDKEQTFRQELWRNGIIKSSQMSPRTHPEYVATEEDPTCIICKQYLYLSAVVCSCRPSSFVCLEHWEHLCECKPIKHRLLYRHTLAEFNDLVLKCSSVPAAKIRLEEMPNGGTCDKIVSCSYESNAMTKKVKGVHTTHKQLAEDWISSSSLIFQTPFSDSGYISALRQAEQFLWAGHEMDLVRDMTKNLIEAQKWAVSVRNCNSKIDSWLDHQDRDIEKVSLRDVETLLSSNPPPCNVPEHSKLKVYTKDATILVVEIKSALSVCSCVTVTELESLYSRSVELPIHLEESERLAKAISSAKVWIDRVRECFSERKLNTIDVDILYKLHNEMSELCVQLPEMELVSDQLRQVNSWQIRCSEILKGPINLKELEIFLQEPDYLSVSFPELKLLRQYYGDAKSWISRVHGILVNIQEREDQGNIVDELTCILRAGELLRVQVDELPLVERELRNSRCRENALKVLASQMPLEFIQQLLTEAASLGIGKEKFFIDICGVRAAAIAWEERAKYLLRSVSQMSEFEDVIRTSEKIFAILPSLGGVKDVLYMAKAWLKRSQPFLGSSSFLGQASKPLLKVEALKDLVNESKFLKVSLKEPAMLRTILKDVEAWEYDTCLLLEHAGAIFNMQISDIKIDNEIIVRIEDLLNGINLATETGRCLGFEFDEIQKLHDAASTLLWILKALSFCRSAPLLTEVDHLMEDAENLPGTFLCSLLGSALVDGARWLKKALLLMPEHQNPKSCKLEDAEEVLNEAQRIKVQFPMVVARLGNAIHKHKSWQGKVNAFFSSKSGKQSWSLLLQLKELGQCDAFSGPDMDKVVSEIGKVDNWILHCKNIVLPLVDGRLLDALVKIKDSLDRAMSLYRTSKECKENAFCVCCASDSENENLLMCLTCDDRYHLSCVGSLLAGADKTKTFTCPFCIFVASGAISRNGGCPLISRGKRPELKALMGTLHDARDFCARIEERDMVEKIVELALACKPDLNSAVDHILAYTDKDFSSVSKRLLISMKAVAVAGVYDYQDCRNLELALTRNSWKIRVKKLFESSRKPSIQDIERMLKEGLAINVPSNDHFMQELKGKKYISLQWANCAKKVAFDSGECELIEVFKLIVEGEELPVHFGKELKLLRDRSVLYCICRKPYDDQREMIACDQCDEWYHFDCIGLLEPPPKTFLCPACKPVTAECLSLMPSMDHDERLIADEEPQTPPPRHSESKRRRPRKARSSLEQKMLVSTDLIKILRCSSEIDHMWRENRRPFRRTARKRTRFESFSQSLHH